MQRCLRCLGVQWFAPHVPPRPRPPKNIPKCLSEQEKVKVMVVATVTLCQRRARLTIRSSSECPSSQSTRWASWGKKVCTRLWHACSKMQWLQPRNNFLWCGTSPFLFKLCNPFPTPSVSASVMYISAHACTKRLDLTRWTLPNSHD